MKKNGNRSNRKNDRVKIRCNVLKAFRRALYNDRMQNSRSLKLYIEVSWRPDSPIIPLFGVKRFL